MKKKAAIVLGVFVLSIVSVSTTMAYMTDVKVAVNQTSIGENTTEIQEVFPTPEPLKPDENQSFEKRVSVTNHSSVACFIRVRLALSDEKLKEYFTYQNLDTEHWVYIEMEDGKLGGYYYYTVPIQPGESTGELFTGLSFSGLKSEIMNNGSFELYVYEESVSQDDYENYRDAWETFIRE